MSTEASAPAVGVADDVAAGALDQGVDPHDVALVLVGLDADVATVVGRRVDDLVPRHGLGHVEAGRVGDRLAVPEDLGVGPQRGDDELAVPRGTVDGALQDAVGQRGLLVRGGDLGEGVGLRELGGEHRIEAHQVDRRVLGRQPAQQLDALLGRARREQLGLDRVLVGAAPLGDAGLAERPAEPGRAGCGSGLMYHVNVGVPLSSPPQPSNIIGAAIAAAATIPIRWRATALVPAPGSTSPQHVTHQPPCRSTPGHDVTVRPQTSR